MTRLFVLGIGVMLTLYASTGESFAQKAKRPSRIDPPPATLADISGLAEAPVFEIIDLFEHDKTRIPNITITPRER